MVFLHNGIKQVVRAINARSIYKRRLHAFRSKHAENSVARGLGFWRNDGYLFAYKHVYERAFSGVSPADNGYITAFHPYKYFLR